MQHFVDPLAMAHSPDGADFSGMEEEEVHFHEARLSPFDAAPLSWRPSDLEEEEGAPRVGDRPAALPLVGRWVAAGGAEAACGESPAPLSKLDSVTNHSEEHLIGAGGAAEDVSDDHSSLLANRDSEAEHSEEDLIGAGGAAEDVSDDHSSLLANRDTESEHSEEERIVDDGGEDGIGELPELIANRASESDHSEEDLSFSAQEAADESSPDDE
jgi:hypothetical protein